MPDVDPFTFEDYDAESTRGALLARLRAAHEGTALVLGELRECREENARLRDLLRPAWIQWHGEAFRPQLGNQARLVSFTVGELRAIAALFTEEEDE